MLVVGLGKIILLHSCSSPSKQLSTCVRSIQPLVRPVGSEIQVPTGSTRQPSKPILATDGVLSGSQEYPSIPLDQLLANSSR